MPVPRILRGTIRSPLGFSVPDPAGIGVHPARHRPASSDTDGDGVPDHLDNGIFVPNTGQLDTDGVGDACDAATCGNGVIEGAGACDGPSLGACPAGCRGDCSCPRGNDVADPKAKIQLKTKKEAGQLNAKMVIPLGAYSGEPVSVRIDDGGSGPLVQRVLASIPVSGSSGTKWQFTSKLDGLQQVMLKDMGPKHPGMFSRRRFFGFRERAAAFAIGEAPATRANPSRTGT